jgi:hypothetical protein
MYLPFGEAAMVSSDQIVLVLLVEFLSQQSCR